MFITRLKNIHKEDIAAVGGKGANLGELCRMGLPVPPGFVITTEGYHHYVAANELQGRIVALAAKPTADDPAAYETASAQIQDLFLAGTVPNELASAIRAAYDDLSAESTTDNAIAVAVRSSATAEDLPSASFAGQQDTYLNIRGPEALLVAVKQCWASLWTARAISYRERQGIDPAAVSLAVVVQQMVDAQAAGILFTANPANGQRGQAVIDAAWGLGEAIVGGQVAPDHWIVDKASGRVLSQKTADKAVMTVRADHGTKEQPVPATQRRRPAISANTATALTRFGVQIEEHYQMPMDIEWAVVADKIFILQARPITVLPEPIADPPTEWPIPFEGAWFVRGSIAEQLPDPLSPLFATLASPQMTKSILNLFAEILGKPTEMLGFVTINGYLYVFTQTGFATWRFYVDVIPAFGQLFRDGLTMWRDHFRPRYLKTIATWQATSPQELRAMDLLTGARELTYRGTELYTGVQMVIPLAVMSETGFAQYYNRLVKRPNDLPAQTLLLGFDSQPIRADKSLYDLAMWSREQPPLAHWLAETPSDQVVDLLKQEAPPAGIADELWQGWRTRFQGYLAQYGYTIYNLDFMYPVPADDPAPLFGTLKFYMQGQGTNPYSRQQDSVIKREELTKAIVGRLDPVRATIFRKLLSWAQRVAPVREDALADVGLGWPLLRQLLLELGRRLVEAEAIDQCNDIFWLEEGEVAQAAAALDAGQIQIDSFVTLIDERKMQWRGRKRATPPQVLPESNILMKLGMEHMLPAGSAAQTGPVIKGVAVGAGRVTAPARVLSGPEDFAQMKPGEVLVADITTPAWTPLFALAAAVVTDVGGPMSHGSIVAREYGIPAVLGTGIATKRIKSGQQIRVDGDAGTVTLLDEIDTYAPQEVAAQNKISVRNVVITTLAAGAMLLFVIRRQRRKQRP